MSGSKNDGPLGRHSTIVKTCVFLGPTLPISRVPDSIDVCGPAVLGSIYKASQAGYKRIGIVDGLFGNVPSVWHKEILFAMSKGASVYGAASLGALRAAELHQYGMVGVGRIYRMFRSGLLTDDDEVAVVHCPAELGYSALSESLVNIRFTLNRMRNAGVISMDMQTAACSHFKSLYFADRSLSGLLEYLTKQRISGDVEKMVQKYYVDVKADDVIQLFAHMCSGSGVEATERLWRFASTIFWKTQFENGIRDVPELQLTRRSEADFGQEIL